MAQDWIVGILAGLAACYSLWYVLPAAARKRLTRVHRLLGRAPVCAACSDCGQCARGLSKPGLAGVRVTEHPVRFQPRA